MRLARTHEARQPRQGFPLLSLRLSAGEDRARRTPRHPGFISSSGKKRGSLTLGTSAFVLIFCALAPADVSVIASDRRRVTAKNLFINEPLRRSESLLRKTSHQRKRLRSKTRSEATGEAKASSEYNCGLHGGQGDIEPNFQEAAPSSSGIGR